MINPAILLCLFGKCFEPFQRPSVVTNSRNSATAAPLKSSPPVAKWVVECPRQDGWRFMQSEVWIWLESTCTSWKIVTSWNHISHFDPSWSRHPLAPFSPTVVPLSRSSRSTLPPPLTLWSSMTWKITSLSFGCQFCRVGEKFHFSNANPWVLNTPSSWRFLFGTSWISSPAAWKIKHVRQEKGRKKGQNMLHSPDVRIKHKDSAICLLIFYWYSCSHMTHMDSNQQVLKESTTLRCHLCLRSRPKCIFDNTSLSRKKEHNERHLPAFKHIHA